MKYNLTEKMYKTKEFMIRVIGEIAKEHVPENSHFISFSGGFPTPSVLPVDMFKKYSAEVLSECGEEILQYGEYTGHNPLKKALRKFLNKQYNLCREEDDILITYGSSEAIYIMANAFINPGDKIIVEDPTYINAINVFALHGAEIIGVPMEDDGVNLEALEAAMAQGAKFFYSIPTFSNPTGITMSREKRKKVYELALKYEIPIFEDNPYGYLRFAGEDIEPIKHYDHAGAVVYAGTASKIISPGIRVGFLSVNKALYDKLAIIKTNGSGGNVNWSQFTLTKILNEVDLDSHIAGIASFYQKRANLMLSEMKKHFHPSMKILEPEGGMFIWVALPDGLSSTQFCMEAAQKLHIAIVPGDGFTINHPEQCTGMRFNFTLPSEEDIIEGIRLIGALTYQYCER